MTGELNFKSPDQKSSLPSDLETFLDADLSPVYITFGSISPYRVQETIDLIIEAVKESGCRAIILTDWDNIQTALRSGCPSIVVEHAFDQTFWGERIRTFGSSR